MLNVSFFLQRKLCITVCIMPNNQSMHMASMLCLCKPHINILNDRIKLFLMTLFIKHFRQNL